MRRRRYVVHPGYVVSRNDGQRHWISATRLLELHHVRPSEHWVDASKVGFRPESDDIDLYPLFDGRYPK